MAVNLTELLYIFIENQRKALKCQAVKKKNVAAEWTEL